MAATLTLDAGILACPRGDVTAADSRAFVEGLLEWSRLLDEHWVTVLTSSGSWKALAADGFLGFYEPVAQLLAASGVVEYCANDVMQVLDRLLYHPPWFEEHLGVDDALVNWEHVATQPDVLSVSAGPNLRRELERCLVLIALHQKRYGNGVDHHVVALCRVPGSVVEVRARVHYGPNGLTPSESEDLEGCVLACDDAQGLIACMDECALLRNATDDSTVYLACRVALYKARGARGGGADWEELSGWRVGESFREAAQRCCRDSADSFATKLLRAVAETIDHENLAAVHWLRTGRGGNDPQKRRSGDGAVAWRRDIDDDYHLHYWRVASGLVELSWVGPHDDFWIPE